MQIEPEDRLRAILIEEALENSGLILTKSENNELNVGMTPALVLAISMRKEHELSLRLLGLYELGFELKN